MWGGVYILRPARYNRTMSNQAAAFSQTFPASHFCAPGKKVVRDYDPSHVGTVLDTSHTRTLEALVQFECEAEPPWCYPFDLEPADG